MRRRATRAKAVPAAAELSGHARGYRSCCFWGVTWTSERLPRPGRKGIDESKGPSADARAIRAVLEAERFAELAVAEAADLAERELAAAREHCRQIGERADERIRRLRARIVASTDAVIAELREEEQDRAAESQRTLQSEQRLRDAVSHVADWLLAPEGRP